MARIAAAKAAAISPARGLPLQGEPRAAREDRGRRQDGGEGRQGRGGARFPLERADRAPAPGEILSQSHPLEAGRAVRAHRRQAPPEIGEKPPEGGAFRETAVAEPPKRLDAARPNERHGAERQSQRRRQAPIEAEGVNESDRDRHAGRRRGQDGGAEEIVVAGDRVARQDGRLRHLVPR